jgi:hypothetical protein
MRIKALKEIISSIVVMKEGDIQDVELDEPTLEYWTACGLIEELTEQTNVASQEPVSPSPDITEAVNTDETQ